MSELRPRGRNEAPSQTKILPLDLDKLRDQLNDAMAFQGMATFRRREIYNIFQTLVDGLKCEWDAIDKLQESLHNSAEHISQLRSELADIDRAEP